MTRLKHTRGVAVSTAVAALMSWPLAGPVMAQDSAPAPDTAQTDSTPDTAQTDSTPDTAQTDGAQGTAQTDGAPDAAQTGGDQTGTAQPDAAQGDGAAPEAAAPDAGSPDAASPDAPPGAGEGNAAAEAAAVEAQAQAEQAAAIPFDSPTPALGEEVGSDWPYYGGSPQAQRYSPLDQITPENVGKLKRAFVYRTGDMPSAAAEGKYAAETTPLKLGGDLFMCSAENIIISIDAATGDENWRFDPKVSDDAIPYSASCRGVSAWTDPSAAEDAACKTRIIEGTIDARLIAVDAKTGEPCSDFGTGGQVDLWDGIGDKVPGWYAVTAPPAIVRGVVVTGAQVKDGQAEDAPSGVIRGYNARTGDMVWAWDLANPNNKNGPAPGETYTRGTPNMWTTAVADEELGYVYLPLGNSSVDYYAGNRSEAENEWATSLVALDVTTGEPAWSFQTVHMDVWDYDLGSQPTLVDFPTDSGTVPAVILPSKQGDIYVLNRETGESLFPVDQVDAPLGDVEPETLSPVQPVSGYANLRSPDLQEKDMWGFSPIDQLYCRIMYRRANYKGFFTAPSADKPFIQYPGYNGGSDWGSIAVDPVNGTMIVNYNDIPNYNQLIPREKADKMGLKPIYEKQQADSGTNAEGEGDPQTGSPYAIHVNAGWRSPLTDMPCTEPPYGKIRAIDLKTGNTLWDNPIGTARRNGPFGIPSGLPFKIGTPNNGGSVVTAGGLIFIAAATDNEIRAIDEKTGEVLWRDTLPAGGQANPIVYEANGKQYVMIAATGHHFMETGVGDQMIAYALPDGS